MSKGTIIYMGNFELPDKNAAAHRVINNGKILSKLGYEVVYIDRTNEIEWSHKHYKLDNINNLKCWRRPYPKTKLQVLNTFYDIKREKEILLKYPNLKCVILYNYPAIALSKLNRFCKKRKVKCIADVTEWYGEGNNKDILSRIMKKIDTHIRMEYIQKKLDGLIVISRFLEEYYQKHTSVLYLPPLVDISDNKWNINIENNESNYNFVYAGSPSSEKERLDVILDCFINLNKLRKDIKLNIIGITKEQFLSIYKYYYIKDHDEFDKVANFIGRVSHITSLNYVKKADFSLIIRDNNRVTKAGFPTKFVESITSKTAVIATDNSDLKDYIIDGVNGYIVSADNLYTEILKILNNNIPKRFDNTVFDYNKYLTVTNNFILKIIGE